MDTHYLMIQVNAAIAGSVERNGVTLHQSFLLELENYSLHRVVCDLPVNQLTFVLETIGEGAMMLQYEIHQLGGGHIREIISKLCSDPFSDCSFAALRILQLDAKSPAEAARELLSEVDHDLEKDL